MRRGGAAADLDRVADRRPIELRSRPDCQGAVRQPGHCAHGAGVVQMRLACKDSSRWYNDGQSRRKEMLP
jgi:hypothetical protein